MSVLVSGLSKAFINGFLKGGRDTTNAISEVSAKSLVEMGGAANVEPITVIDSSLVPYDALTDVLKLLNTQYAAYYLAAGAISTHVGRIDTVKLLDKLNPSRSIPFNIANSILLGRAIDATESLNLSPVNLSKRKFATTLPRVSNEAGEPGAAEQSAIGSAQIRGNASVTDLSTVANLSIGQNIKLPVQDGDSSRTIDVNVRLIAYPAPASVLRTVLTWSEKDTSLKTRIRAFSAGELSFWRDLVFMRDIFVERRKALLEDKSGIFQALSARVNRNILAGIASMTPSAGTVSSIMVISESNLANIETEIGGRLEDFKVRQRIMNTTGLMIIAVVDPMDEFVTIYTYSRPLKSTYSFKQIKTASKGGGDLMELVKLMNAGSGSKLF